jgi:hypothetical protein
LVGGEPKPAQRFRIVTRDTETAGKHFSKVHLSRCLALVRSQPIPPHRLHIVTRYAATVLVHPA